MNAEARAEFLTIRNAVGQGVFKVPAQIIVRLHGHDIGAIGEQQKVFGNL